MKNLNCSLLKYENSYYDTINYINIFLSLICFFRLICLVANLNLSLLFNFYRNKLNINKNTIYKIS